MKAFLSIVFVCALLALLWVVGTIEEQCLPPDAAPCFQHGNPGCIKSSP